MRLRVKIIAGARQEKIVGWLGRDLKIKVIQPAEQGKANKAIMTLMAKTLGVSVKSISIATGATAAYKIVQIEDLDEESFQKKISAAIADN